MQKAIALPALLPFFLVSQAVGNESQVLTSPDGNVTAHVGLKDGSVVYRVEAYGRVVLEDARLGVTVDGVDMGAGAKSLAAGEVTEHKETYFLHGDDGEVNAHDRRVTLTVTRDGEPLVMEWRAFNDGVGFRYRIGGDGSRKVGGEATSWTIPSESKLWYRTNQHGDYSGRVELAVAGSFPQAKDIVGPLLVELPGKSGYVGITEADPWNSSGLSFVTAGERSVRAKFVYDSEWVMKAGSATAWRVVMTGKDLNQVMRGRQLVTHLSPPADPALYPDGAKTKWIQPGRSAWSWLDPHARARGGVNPDAQKKFIDMAADLGFEYNTVDDGWEMWPDKWKTLADLAAYAKQRNVKVFAWKDTADGDRVPDPTDNYANLRAFLDKCKEAGLAGIKIDFLWGNPLIGEGSKTLGFMPVVYRLAAERGLMVNFHGAVKPTGQARTWPNAITQEPVLGMEAGAAPADAAIVAFLCGLSGYCDYTPGAFQAGAQTELRGKSTWAHQLALGIVFCSPIQHWASGPELMTQAFPSGSVERQVLQAIPASWDETVVLEAGEVGIGGVAAFARRKGKDWFLGVINGNEQKDVHLPKTSLAFLGDGRYRSLWVADGDKPDAFRSGTSEGLTKAQTVDIKLSPGGGFSAWFRAE